MSDEVELQIAWAQIALPSPRSRAVFEDVVGRYRQPHRRYHGVRHMVWVLRHARRLEAAIDGCTSSASGYDPVAVSAAAFFHDAIYDPRSGDNEERSALLAERELASLDWPPERCRLVADVVRATAGHAADGESLVHAVLLDADLAVLGAEPSAYAAYVNGVRSEYGHLSLEQWSEGRAAVLRRFLDRPHVYTTAPARAWWEELARANVAAELAGLKASG